MGSTGHQFGTVQRVLFIPELLDMIFSYLDLSDNVVNARICKRWCEVALDTLWREVDDMHRLCSILVPLFVADTSEYKFTRSPESSDWKRFERYSGRVRRLCYRPDSKSCPISQSVFDDIARTRTSLAILPNMHTLEWEGSLTLCVMFMHSNVRRFAIRLPYIVDLTSADVSFASDSSQVSPSPPKNNSVFGPFFTDVVDRMSNLTHLNIKMNFAISKVEGEVVELLQGLKKLKKFTAPQYCITTDVMNALSKPELLGCIEFQYSENQGRGDPGDVVEFKPTVEEGAFPSLWDLGLAAGYDDFTRFINAPFAPTNLRMLYLDSQIFEAPDSIKLLLVSLSENCQLLQSLALLSRVDVMNGIQYFDPADEQCITFDTLKPLLNCPNLTSFELVHGCPVVVMQDEIEELAEKWPSLETLLLNNEPGFINDAHLSLDALLPFAKHCPRLRHLGLFINASTAEQTYNSIPTSSLTPTKRGRAPYCTPSFKSLRKLSMGVSPISDINGVTLFLSSICPVECQVESGVTWDEKMYVPPDVVRSISVRCERWVRVEEMLPGMIELRLQEREWSKELEKENEDLKIRNSVLLDKLGLNVIDDSCVTT